MVIHQGENAKGHLHPVPNAGLPPEAATVIEVIIIIDHFDVTAAAAVVGSLRDDVGFGDDPRFRTRLGVSLQLVGGKEDRSDHESVLYKRSVVYDRKTL